MIRVDSRQFSAKVGFSITADGGGLRVDSDVIAFFKQQGKGYQRLMNFALQAYMLRRKSAESTKSATKGNALHNPAMGCVMMNRQQSFSRSAL